MILNYQGELTVVLAADAGDPLAGHHPSQLQQDAVSSGCRRPYTKRCDYYKREHCEKSLFVLASRLKIPVSRTENPAVNTRTTCLLPIEFFLNYPCQKSHGWKIPARNNRYGWKIPAFWSLEGDFLHSLAGTGKTRKSRPVTAGVAGKFGCQ